MTNAQDTLVADGREDGYRERNSGGALLAVLATLVFGFGLVFAAYKLGERTGVEEPPLIRAESGPIKENQPRITSLTPSDDNAAFAMVDKRDPVMSPELGLNANGGAVTGAVNSNPGGGYANSNAYASRDGRVAELPLDPLPERQVETELTLLPPPGKIEAVDLDSLTPSTSIRSGPNLTQAGPEDRSDERLRAGLSEVAAAPDLAPAPIDGFPTALALDAPKAAVDGVIDPVSGAISGVVTAAANGRDALLGQSEPGRIELDTALGGPEGQSNTLNVASRVPGFAGSIAAAPSPRPKPALARAPAALRTAQTNAPAIERAEPAAATLVRATPSGAASNAQPQSRRVAALNARDVPRQPTGDAQVQLGAMPSHEEARSRWYAIKNSNPDLLASLGLQVAPVALPDGRTLHRMRVGPLADTASAGRLCEQLSFRGIECFVPQR